ncbi:MAG: DUF294 nucleotidyltransferase-like domain-containing protein [Thermodesulfobacteriota bacterium]
MPPDNGHRGLLDSGGDKLLFTTPIREVLQKAVITAPAAASIREAAGVMARHRISSLVLVDGAGTPAGMVTDRDLRDKVAAQGRDVDTGVGGIMSTNLRCIEASQYCFEAVLKMIQENIHHLLVMDQGRLAGIITNHDLMMVQGTSPIAIVREIEVQSSIAGLVPAAEKVNRIIGLLAKEGARASNIMRIITEINDRLVKKVLQITERALGPPPLPYCWIGFGSEGRQEQTFRTDQDNALVLADAASPQEAGAAAVYFETFSLAVRDALALCGFPLCTGGYMAANPQWRQPLAVWKDLFSRWLSTPTPEALLRSVIFFDFRPLAGEIALGAQLRAHLAAALPGRDMFFKHLAEMTARLRPPLNLWKGFILEKTGTHKGMLNLKVKCLAPLIDIVRLFSLEKALPQTGTLERLAALRPIHQTAADYGDELAQAFEFLSLLRIRQQLAAIEVGTAPDNYINPYRLSMLERRLLREACEIISRVQDSIVKRYRPGTTM